MGREIKFRAWDKKSNKMRAVESIGFGAISIFEEGYPVCNMLGHDIINQKPVIIHRDSPHFELMQYTGLKDKNDKEIYEGDIVALDSLGGFVVEYDNENARFMFNGEHKDKDYGHCGFHLYAQKEIEVIGNIYENADLLR